MSITLYGYWRSSSTWRVRIALAHKGIPYETAVVHLVKDGGEQRSEAFKKLNPRGEVPLLQVMHAGQPFRVAQSMAIIEYLEETHPEPALLPREPLARARARHLAEMVNAGIQPLQNLRVLQYVKSTLGGDDQAWARAWIHSGLQALEQEAQASAGPFLVGDAVSLADVFMVPQLYNARRFNVDLTAFPTLTRVEARCMELPAFVAAHPDKQPDAPTQAP